jgi:type VI secretion system protein ImpF
MESRDKFHNLGREPKPISGLSAPLFDRLTESGAGVSPSYAGKVLDRNALLESVRQEIGRILNTRNHLSGTLREFAEGTVLDYGIPNFSHVSPASPLELQQLGDLLARRIASAEPRLASVQVRLQPDPASPKSAIGIVRAVLRIGSVVEPVTFPLEIDPGVVAVGLARAAGA